MGWRRKKLLRAAKLFFELAEVHFNQRGPSVRAGVGHGATAQIIDEILQFRAGERVVGFDGVTANGLGDGMFAQAQRIHVMASGFQFIDEFEHKFARVGDFDEWRQGVEEEGAFAEFRETNAEAAEGGELFANESGIAGGQLDGFRQQKFLRVGLLFLLEAREHLLEENPLVRGVLIEQNQAAIGFENDVEFSDDADQAEGDA
jgi:hypothetical protein